MQLKGIKNINYLICKECFLKSLGVIPYCFLNNLEK